MLTTQSSDCITHHSSIGSSHSSFDPHDELQEVCAPREQVAPVHLPVAVKKDENENKNKNKNEDEDEDELNNQDIIKQKFISMINVAIAYRQKHIHDAPIETQVVFDYNNNVRQMRMLINGNVEYLDFNGNPQYIPPEVSINRKYDTEMADVWVLGVSLYRMLAGKYPFEAPNDRILFEKMLQSDYIFPDSIPPDAVDLIQLMLVPDNTRIPLDFIISHPWLDPPDRDDILEPPNPFGHRFTKSPPPLDSPSLPRSRSVEFQKPPKQKKFVKRKISRLVGLLFKGPNQPPQYPYRDLANVGRPATTTIINIIN
ncbi:kinase-like domain-containing protein [Phycomyces blakesleeanus]